MRKSARTLTIAVLASIALLFVSVDAANVTIDFVTIDGLIPSNPNISCILASSPGGFGAPGVEVWHVTQSSAPPASPIFVNMTSGDYLCEVNIPGYYKYIANLKVNTASMFNKGASFILAPVSLGVSVFTSSPQSRLLGAVVNMTFPSGVFDFPYAVNLFNGDYSPAPSGFSYGDTSALPRPTLFAAPYVAAMNLYAAKPGTYKIGLTAKNGNFTVSPLSLYVFAGTDRTNGFIGSVTTNNTRSDADSTFWYAADVIVTNPSLGCADYSLAIVDQYESSNQFPSLPPTTSDLILSECYDMSPAAQSCNSLLYSPNETISTCGVFGDPHVLKFDQIGVTCGFDETIILAENDLIKISAKTSPAPNATNGATDISTVTFEFKGSCNPLITTFSFNVSGGLLTQFENSPTAGNQRVRVLGNNLYIDSLRIRLQVRQVAMWISSGYRYVVTFGLSMPSSMAASSTGICQEGCPAGTEISMKKRAAEMSDRRALEEAQEICEETYHVSPGTFYHETCTFDIATTGISQYGAASSSGKNVVEDVQTHWENDPIDPSLNPLPPVVPVPSPSPSNTPSNSPSSPTPSSSPKSPVSKSPSNAGETNFSSKNGLVLIALVCAFVALFA